MIFSIHFPNSLGAHCCGFPDDFGGNDFWPNVDELFLFVSSWRAQQLQLKAPGFSLGKTPFITFHWFHEKLNGTLPTDPYVSCYSYKILRCRGPFIRSCWRFLGLVCIVYMTVCIVNHRFALLQPYVIIIRLHFLVGL